MSLSHHLLESGDHDRLGFHSGCPVCRRERLAGLLSVESVLSRRVSAALAAGLLAFSAGAPVAAVAVEPDTDREGEVPPQVENPNDLVGGDDDDDPGGDDTDTPSDDDPGEPPATPGGEENGGPVAQPPALVREPLVEEPTPQPPSTTPATPGAQPRPNEEAAPAPPRSPEASPRSAQPKNPAKTKQHRRGPSQPARQVARTPPTPSSVPTPAAAPVEQSQSAAARTASPAGAEAGAPAAVARSARTYVVRSGDNLWSIARGLLGVEASPAKIAGEVHRLWRLNAERIGTGDPDLIMVGQTLRLR